MHILRYQSYNPLSLAYYEKAAEVLKNDRGITLDSLSNREKATVIDALRNRYSLKELLIVLHIAKSSYCYQAAVLRNADKYGVERENIRELFSEVGCIYGYRRIWQELRNNGQIISEKVVRRIMREENLVVISAKRKKYSSYQGEISPAVPNLLERNFHADQP